MDSISNLTLLLCLLLSATHIASSAATSATTAAEQDHPKKQMENIVDALIGAGDFGNWASILSSADPSILPVTATLFLPSDSDYDAISAASAAHLSPFLLFPYHVVPERFSFADLLKFPTNTRLPTLLPGFSLLITNNSRFNFSIDGSQITHPDLYQNAAVSAHGISAPFDYTVFGAFDYTAVFGNSSDRFRHLPPPTGDFKGSVSGSPPLWGLFLGSKILALIISWV